MSAFIKPDVVVDIRYTFVDGSPSIIKIFTNVKHVFIEEVISNWLQDQMGQGEDKTPFTQRETYTIKIGLEISTDSFGTESNTGNKGLTAGIVADVLQNLEKAVIAPLSDAPKEGA